jgi:hypothetical protein
VNQSVVKRKEKGKNERNVHGGAMREVKEGPAGVDLLVGHCIVGDSERRAAAKHAEALVGKSI